MNKLVLFLSAIAVIVACSPKEENKTTTAVFDVEKVKAAIVESNKTYGESFTKSDSVAFINHYTKDGCIMPSGAPKMCGSAAIGMFYSNAKNAMGVTTINLVTEEVMGGADAIVETGTYELLGAANKSLDKGKFLVSWKQEEGKWKMHRDMFTTNTAH